MCRPAGLNLAGGRGLRARYGGAEEDDRHLEYLRRELRTSLRQLLCRGGRCEERGGRVGATGYRGHRVPGTGRARRMRVYDVWTVSGGGGSMHPLRY